MQAASSSLPSIEDMVTVPFGFVLKHTTIRREVEVLAKVSSLAVKLDALLALYLQGCSQMTAADEHFNQLQGHSNPHLSTLLPLLTEFRKARERSVSHLRHDIDATLRDLGRERDHLTWSAALKQTTAEQVQAHVPSLAAAQRRMAAVENELVSRLHLILSSEGSIYRSCRHADTYVTMADFCRKALESRDGTPSRASSAAQKDGVGTNSIGPRTMRHSPRQPDEAEPHRKRQRCSDEGAGEAACLPTLWHGGTGRDAQACVMNSELTPTDAAAQAYHTSNPAAALKKDELGDALSHADSRDSANTSNTTSQ